MRRSLLCLALAIAATACRGDEEGSASATGEQLPIYDPADAPEVRTPDRRPPAGQPFAAPVTPEFRLRLDPSRHTLDATIEIDLSRPDTIHLLFRKEWAGYPGLDDRLTRLEAWGASGALDIAPDAGYLGAGHHLVGAPAAERVTIRYTMSLTPAHESLYYHRASQLDGDGGHLFGGDLLPRVWVGIPQSGPVAAQISFTGMPGNWRVATIDERAGGGYHLADIIESVFIVGPLRTKRLNVGPRSLTTAIHGRWPVSDDRVFDAVNRIAGNLHRIAGDGWAPGAHLLGAGRVPARVPGLSTGGQVIGKSGIVYVGGSGPAEIEFRQWMFTTAHELMHWYIPIGFPLREEPPRWFAEGFTDYMALKSLLVGDLIEPQVFLDEIAERLNRYRSSPIHGTRSIVAAESDFWQNDTYRFIYDGGAAAAFLLDLGFQDRAGSLERALREARRSSPLTVDRLITVLAGVSENEWIHDWLASGADPDWDARLETYGLRWDDGTLVTRDGWATNVLASIRP